MSARSDGWDLFETLLHVHHTVEDDSLWPVVREAVAGRPDDLALLGEMAEEHAALGPVLETIDAALGRRDSAPNARAEQSGNGSGNLCACLMLFASSCTRSQSRSTDLPICAAAKKAFRHPRVR